MVLWQQLSTFNSQIYCWVLASAGHVSCISFLAFLWSSGIPYISDAVALCRTIVTLDALYLDVRYKSEDEICKVLSFVGGSRDPDAPSLFQVANVDTGEIKTIHAAEVKEIVSTYEQEVKKRLESTTSTEQQ